jgi:signal transduction histidine kinase/DNA-binding response OmpR family regulator
MDEPVNILVVDDLPEKLLVIETILEGPGLSIVKADSGRDALRKLLEREYAVILLDVNMPDIDGFETAELIRQRKQTAHTPIIFVTAFGDELHTSKGYSLGAVDYILSPVVPEILRTKVGVFVELFRKTQQVRLQAEEHVALAREQAARAAAEAATRRSSFLAEASRILVRSFDVDAMLRGLAAQVVPFLADLCAITLVDELRRPWRWEIARVDEQESPCHGEAAGPAVRRLGSVADAIDRCLAEETSVLIRDCPASDSTNSQPAFVPRSVLAIPLQARGRMLGSIALCFGPSERRYGTDELTLAEDLAGRAAIAFDNARLYRDIQEGDRRKNEFLAMLAHELRNPLAPIRNAVELLLRKEPADPDVDWARDLIARQVHTIVRMVDDLLDISRITGGKIHLRTEHLDVTEAVERAVETSRPLIDARRHALTVSCPREPLAVEADAARLAQVLANLLNNAAKYTPEGGHIAFIIEREDGQAVFRVRDDGVGIASDMLPKVFDLFTQVDPSLDRAQGGLGIGLTLVRRLVELHGGSVEAHSEGPGKGSEFVLRFPAAPPRKLPSPNGSGAARWRRGPPSRILVVDDNVDSARSLAKLLKLSGHDLHVAHDGPGALEAVRSVRPEIVLLDIGLPGMNGFDVARAIRRETPERMLLVALTGYGQESDRVRSREAGFDYHLVKPVDLDRLTTLIADNAPRSASS